MLRQTALTLADQRFEADFEAGLAALVVWPTESQNPERADLLRDYLSKEMRPRLEALGATCSIHDNSDPTGGPFLIGQRLEADNLPTVLIYAHGDVTPGQSARWRHGLAPFELVREGDRLYGRGTADNKGQFLINLLALHAVLASRGRLGFNVKFLIEMGEETGSPGLAAFARTEATALSADVLIASDGPRLQPDVPTLFMGSRGALNFDLFVHLREGEHHSGNWGGLLADPAIILAHAIATIADARGQLLVPEWHPDSLTQSVRDALRDLPIEDEMGPAIDPNWGEAALTPAERVFGWNSFAVLAMTSGTPDAPVNAISGTARATCQLRFVVGTDEADILPALRRHLDRNGFATVGVEARDRGAFAATRLDPEHPWVQFATASATRTTGRAPHILPNLAGSLPNEVFAEVLGLPTVWVPHSYRACCQHAPDEHVLVSVCQDATRVMTGLFWDIGDGETPA